MIIMEWFDTGYQTLGDIVECKAAIMILRCIEVFSQCAENKTDMPLIIFIYVVMVISTDVHRRQKQESKKELIWSYLNK